MAYDVEAIRIRVNSMIANLRKACDDEDWDTVEKICCSPLYDEYDIPRVKRMYKVTLKRVMTYDVEVEAYDEDNAIYEAEYNRRLVDNMNDWECDQELDSDVEELD